MQSDPDSYQDSSKDTQAQRKMTNPKTVTAKRSRMSLCISNFGRRSFLGRAGVVTAVATSVATAMMSPVRSSTKRGDIAYAQNTGERNGGSQILQEVLSANQTYVKNFGDKSNLPLPPGRRFAILTCMDARLDPAKYAGLSEGDAHVIRNAGGRASDDAIRSLVISYKLLGTKEWFVIHHTNCGMEFFTDQVIRKLLSNSLTTAVLDENGFRDVGQRPGSTEGEFINWLTINDQVTSVAIDVRRIRFHPLVPRDIPIYGYLYDVKTGELIEIPEATEIGRAA
ncbi:carbonic anhydrase [Scytonema hofmannii]|uniref:carbonic anhydrase n=1 Tax=Scytonema hofmannii TaxID=34078 RepID=UPI0003482104|nr:carbonic anhydrase [Scytonema hofmannii]